MEIIMPDASKKRKFLSFFRENTTQSEHTPPLLDSRIHQVLFGIEQVHLFSEQDLNSLSETSRDLSIATRRERRKRSLICDVVCGRQDSVELTLEAMPTLLLIKNEGQDYSGRKIIGTPFQAALGAGDQRMWESMMGFFTVLEKKGVIDSAQKEMKRQFDDQFPQGIKDTPFTDLLPLYNELADAIISNQDNSDSAIALFRSEITKHREITSGKHFNMQHLTAAYQSYINNFNRLKTHDNRDKFWQKVIGYVQRQMPANCMQEFLSGVASIIKDPDLFKRTLKTKNGIQLFPQASSDTGLGFDYAITSFPPTKKEIGTATDGCSPQTSAPRPVDLWIHRRKLNYLDRKVQALLNLQSSLASVAQIEKDASALNVRVMV